MGDLVNLNKFRKRKAKAERKKHAEVNQRLHGRTKIERLNEATQKHRLSAQVDGAHLERPAPVAPALTPTTGGDQIASDKPTEPDDGR